MKHAFAIAFAAISPLCWSNAEAQTSNKPEAVAPYAATLTIVVDAMLKLADVGPDDFLVDLGSGDGRIVIAGAHQEIVICRASGSHLATWRPKAIRFPPGAPSASSS